MNTTPRLSYEDIHEHEGCFMFEFDLLSAAKHLFPDCESNREVASKFVASKFSSPAWRNCSTPTKLRFAFDQYPQGVGLVDMLNNYLTEKARLLDHALEF